jgi:hypothetical protein
VAAASPTTALIHTALELLLSIDGLQDLRGKTRTKGVCPQNEIRKSIVKINSYWDWLKPPEDGAHLHFIWWPSL